MRKAKNRVVDDPDMASTRSGARRQTWLRIGGGTAAAIAVLIGGVWLERKPIAIHFIAQTLRAKGVAATYEVTRIGPRTQRLEHLVLGDPAHPDLTADWIEVDLGYSFSGIRVTRLRTGTVAVSARYRNGKLELGSLDRLIGEGTGGKTELPDIVAQLKTVRIRLATDGRQCRSRAGWHWQSALGLCRSAERGVAGPDAGRLHAERPDGQDHRRDRCRAGPRERSCGSA